MSIENDPALQAAFRSAMGNVAGPVSVVTTHAAGKPAGTTVSAFVSLSMEPPMLLVSLMRGSYLLSLLSVGSTIGVNVLGAHQTALATQFTGRHDERFVGVDWVLLDGAPALADAHAWVSLRVARLVPVGDHVLVLGDVVNAVSEGAELPGGPLTYHRRSFGTHQAH
ncbi:flavin reductase family protein [Nocardioides sp. 1609]|uniref:flavin reductase family protein n=1 Tax=Nocardioides sp. 1609 TaxID=2508327 RepID=UPI00106F9F8F|nr:flavin reductase family protein [Nocardioides sp. 1609]